MKSNEAQKVEKKLNDIRNEHALAINIWKGANCGGTPKRLSTLQDYDKKNTRFNKNSPLLSLSLLPSDKSGVSIIPWHFNAAPPTVSYLFNLRQTDDDSPRVLTVHPFNSNSGKGNYKSFNIENTLPELKKIYAGGEYKEKAKNPEYTKQQLQALGNFYETNEYVAERKKRGEKSCYHNEIIAAVKTKDIAAVAVPVDSRESYPPLVNLYGAIYGLNHLEKGINVPVVKYHVHHKTTQGKIEYIGQGKEELKQIALQAVKDIQHNFSRRDNENTTPLLYFTDHKNNEFDLIDLAHDIRKHLGIDVNIFLSEQKAAVTKLEKEIRTGKTIPFP